MYFKLALKNVKKSYKDYFVYFITLTISVALFYVFNSFEAQQKILVSDPDTVFAFKTLASAMGILSYFVTFVFGFLILYANNFIMKRRKKEIALYTLLGMQKSRVSRIMLYETFIVGLVSLATGIVLGVVISQGVAAFIGYLLQMSIEYQLVISVRAIVSTLISFTLIFVIVGIFNNIIMSKAKLIDLFKARQTNEKVIVKHPVLMTLIMIVSIGVLAYLYYFVMQPMQLLKYLLQVLIIGSLATFGLFYGLSFWFVEISQRLKKYYYRDLNAFTTRQISSKISSTYKLLASVSLMLLLSFGSLATAFNVNSIINNMFNQETIYDFNIDIVNEDLKDIDMIEYLDLDPKYDVNAYDIYQTHFLTIDFEDDAFLKVPEENPFGNIGIGISLMNVEDYNFYIQREEKEAIALKDNEIVYYIDEGYKMGMGLDSSDQIFKDDFKMAGVDLHVLKHEDNDSKLGSTLGSSGMVFVANQETIETIKEQTNARLEENLQGYTHKILNVNFAEDQDPEVETTKIKELLEVKITGPSEDGAASYYNLAAKHQAIKQGREMTLLLTFVGLYLGLTFIVVCVMVISLQLLSEASDNYDRYLLLDKIGVNNKIQKRSIFKQNLIYFALPLIVALIHSFVGISAVNDTMAFGGLKTVSYKANLLGVGILAGIYIIYFLVTYFSSVRMIFDRKNH